jgi:hypothetical protein
MRENLWRAEARLRREEQKLSERIRNINAIRKKVHEKIAMLEKRRLTLEAHAFLKEGRSPAEFKQKMKKEKSLLDIFDKTIGA